MHIIIHLFHDILYFVCVKSILDISIFLLLYMMQLQIIRIISFRYLLWFSGERNERRTYIPKALRICIVVEWADPLY